MKEEEDKKEVEKIYEEKKYEENKDDHNNGEKILINDLKKDFDTLITQNKKDEQVYNQLKFAIGKTKSIDNIGIFQIK